METLRLIGLSLFFFAIGAVGLSWAIFLVRDAVIAVAREREAIRRAAVEEMATRARVEMSKVMEQFRVSLLTEFNTQATNYLTQIREAVSSVAAAGKTVQ